MADLTVSAAAASLGLARDTVLKQITNGVIAARRLGPIWVISQREVERYRVESLGRKGRRKA